MPAVDTENATRRFDVFVPVLLRDLIVEITKQTDDENENKNCGDSDIFQCFHSLKSFIIMKVKSDDVRHSPFTFAMTDIISKLRRTDSFASVKRRGFKLRHDRRLVDVPEVDETEIARFGVCFAEISHRKDAILGVCCGHDVVFRFQNVNLVATVISEQLRFDVFSVYFHRLISLSLEK